MSVFKNRKEAGELLAEKLIQFRGDEELIVLGLPRGGVPVAMEIAKALKAPLDILMVRKLGVPGHEELAMGAIASGGIKILNQDIIQNLSITDALIQEAIKKEKSTIFFREALYRASRKKLELKGKHVILADDGLATGATMLAAIRAIMTKSPTKITVAIPVAPKETCDEITKKVSLLVCIYTPDPFGSVGLWYRDFPQVTDEEVAECLQMGSTFLPQGDLRATATHHDNPSSGTTNN